ARCLPSRSRPRTSAARPPRSTSSSTVPRATRARAPATHSRRGDEHAAARRERATNTAGAVATLGSPLVRFLRAGGPGGTIRLFVLRASTWLGPCARPTTHEPPAPTH